MAAEPPGTVPASESGATADVEAPGSVSPPELEPEPQVDENVNARTAREPDAHGLRDSDKEAAAMQASCVCLPHPLLSVLYVR